MEQEGCLEGFQSVGPKYPSSCPTSVSFYQKTIEIFQVHMALGNMGPKGKVIG